MSKIGYFLPRDGNGEAIQCGAAVSISDASGSAHTSPVAIATGTRTSLIVPGNAVEFTIIPSQDMYFAPDASASANHGTLAASGLSTTYAVTPSSTVSLIAATAGNAYFYFTLLAGDSD